MEIGVNHSSGNLSIDMTHENIFEKLREPIALGAWGYGRTVWWSSGTVLYPHVSWCTTSRQVYNTNLSVDYDAVPSPIDYSYPAPACTGAREVVSTQKHATVPGVSLLPHRPRFVPQHTPPRWRRGLVAAAGRGGSGPRPGAPWTPTWCARGERTDRHPVRTPADASCHERCI